MFIYEKMNDDNIEGIALLEKENFSDGWSLESLKEETDNPDALYMCVRDDGNQKIIAAAGMIISFETADIMNVSVDKEYRRRNIAKDLLLKLFEEGRKRGVCEFTLEVRAGNEPARKLYEKLGFTFAGNRPGFYSNPKEDAAIYWLKDN